LSAPIAVEIAPTEARWVSVALRVPPETAGQSKPGAHEIHFNVERIPTVGDDLRTVNEKSTFVLPR